jgi:hypothetical protein
MSTATITVRVALTIRKRGGRKLVVLPDGAIQAAIPTVAHTRADPALVKALARAFRYQRLLDEGRYSSVSEMAEAEKIERGYLGGLLRLTLLAPDLVANALDGRPMPSVTLAALFEPFPLCWRGQRDLFAYDGSRR